MNAPVKANAVAARARAIARHADTLAAQVATVSRVIDAHGSASTQDLCRVIARTRSQVRSVCVVAGLHRSDESPDHAHNAPVFYGWTLDAALAGERAWVAARAERSPAVVVREPRRLRIRQPKLGRRPGATPGAPVSFVVMPVSALRDEGDIFACERLDGARLMARACVARQRSERIECVVCRDCAVGREVARRVRA